MTVVVWLPSSFSPLSSPSSPSASLSSSSAPSGALNCRFKSDVSRPKCVCEKGGSAMMLATSSAPSLGPQDGTRSVVLCSAAASSFCSQAAPVVAGAAGGGKIHLYSTGRLLSSSSTISGRRKGRNGFGFGEGSRIRTSVHKGERRWKACQAKDTSRDVLTDPAEASRQRLTITRNGEEQEEVDLSGSQNGELAEETEVLSEDERVLKAETLASEVEKESPATAAPAEEKGDGGFGNTAALGSIAAGLGLLILLGGFGAVGYLYKDALNEFLIQFSDFLEGYGPAGYGLFVLVYAGLELLAIPAIPLTMSAGLLFGAAIGTIIVSIAGTIAATGAFLISRYLARDRILALAKGNKKFLAIDKAIGDDGFRVVTLLRLSPLLPFSLGNYLYGLTSVKLGPYVLGSWLGMLPGSWAYVSAGALSRSFIIQSENEPIFSGAPEQWWTLGLGIAATVFAATYVTRLAKEALKDIDE
ncbi:unnamed protein product [Calypogeia fissa]